MRKLIPLLAIGAAALAAFSGCQGPVVEQPDKLWVDATRAHHDTIDQEYLQYVQADEALSAEQKQDRVDAVGDFNFMIEQGELATGGLLLEED